MVRETRHLWVGNLPENIREERIREHFKRYGRVQSVKLLPRCGEEKTSGGEVTVACTVAFMDIKSASKAHNAELKIDDRTLNTEYYEPAAIPSPATAAATAAAAASVSVAAAAASPQNNQPSPYATSPGSIARYPNGHGSSDDHGTGPFVDRCFYDRPTATSRLVGAGPSAASSADLPGGYRNGQYGVSAGAVASDARRSSWGYDRYAAGGNQTDTGYVATPSECNQGVAAKKKTANSRSGSRSPSPSVSASTRSPSRSRSRSSSSSSSSSMSRDTSSTGSPKSKRLTSNSSASNSNHQPPVVHTDDRRPLAICVKNLPARSSDTSLKDGLFHEYKKHGKVTWVKVVGKDADRHAVVCFKKPEDAEKALEVSYDKLFFGCKIEVAAYQGCDVEDNDLRPYECDIDEYHPKATRTLFIGNLEKDVTASELRKHFDQFGEIIEIDIKKQGAVSSYAFCQYSDIVSVVKAIRKMDGEHLGNNRIKLGFGKSMPYNCVWIDGINDSVNDKYLKMQFEPFGVINKLHIDRDKGQALVFYEQVISAQTAVAKMRGFTLKNTKIQVDFASRECQESFFERLEKQGAVLERTTFDERREPINRTFDITTPRYSRYDTTTTRPRTSSYSSRSNATAGQTGSLQSPGTPVTATPRGSVGGTGAVGGVGVGARTLRRFPDYYDQTLEYADRHFRSYDEYSQSSTASHEDLYEHEYGFGHDAGDPLQTIENVPFAPPDMRNLQKERVHLLEQLEDCPSSGDELISPKKRMKLELLDTVITSDVIIEANRDHRKVMEVRRLSDVNLKHHSRRPSMDSSKHVRHDVVYVPHSVCKRRKTAGSDSNAGSKLHHYDHSGSESVGGSRPGTPLCDERPENFPPSEPRRVPREREGPLTLPLPRFASQIINRGPVSVAGIKGQKDNVLSSPPPAVTSPRISSAPRPPSPVHVPPPASPPPRPPSLSSNSSDSDAATPPSPSLDERIKSLDEKYEKWSGSRALSAAGGDALALLDANIEKFRQRHKIFDFKEAQPSDIVKSVMAKRSVFDDDLKRLENVGEKYEPKEFAAFQRVTQLPAVTTATIAASLPLSALKINTTNVPPLPKTPTVLSPRSTGIQAAKGLQYPFPTHPPNLLTSSSSPSSSSPSPITTTQLPLLTTAPSAIVATAVTTVTAATATSTSTSTTSSSSSSRGASHGDNRLKPCPSVPSDARTCSKMIVNKTSLACAKISEKIEKIVKVPSSRRECGGSGGSGSGSGSSPRADVKIRRNSDTSARRSDQEVEQSRKERAQSEERKRERAKIEHEKLEKEKCEQEKLRVDKENESLEKQKEKERIEKERSRIEAENLRKAQREKEALELKERAEKLEQERKEKEEIDKRLREEQEKTRLEKEKHEREKKERDDHNKIHHKDDKERLVKHKEDNHDRKKDDHNKHRESHNSLDTNRPSKDDKLGSRDANQMNAKEPHESRNKTHIDRDSERRKESIKENRDNNVHEKHKSEKARDIIESRHMSIDSKSHDKHDPSKRKERNNSLPANIGSKRRYSSHETVEINDDTKKAKLSQDYKKLNERRDSKDSTRSEDRLKSSSKHKNNVLINKYDKYVSEEKRREREERHKKHKLEKQKSKSKSREKESLTDREFLNRLELKSVEDGDKQHRKDKEKRDDILHQDKQKKDKLAHALAIEKINRMRSDHEEKKKQIHQQQHQQQQQQQPHQHQQQQQREHRVRKLTSDSDSDEPKKHSIFDIVDDEPAYISMYDKVKARSCKNMAKQEEEKRQEKLKEKFTKLKQSRAKREEKKRSTSWDEDSDSDKDLKVSKRCPKLLLDSSDDDEEDVKPVKKKEIYTDSDSSAVYNKHSLGKIESSDDEILRKSFLKTLKPRITSDTSDDERNKKKLVQKELFDAPSITTASEVQVYNAIEDKSQHLFKIKEEMVKIKKERRNSKHQESDISSSFFAEKYNNKHTAYTDVTTDEETAKRDKERREKKHKKKQKKQKYEEESVDNNSTTSECKSEKKKEHSKKEKRRDKNREKDKSKKSKRSKLVGKMDVKTEDKMENIFGSLSEDSDTGTNSKETPQQPELIEKESPQPHQSHQPVQSHQSHQPVQSHQSHQPVQSLQSLDKEHDSKPKEKSERDREKEEHKRKKEKKRREKERRLQAAAAAAAAASTATIESELNDNSMDYICMGKQLEANMLRDDGEVFQTTPNPEKPAETVVDERPDIPEAVETKRDDKRDVKEKKKKRKKSKDEKSKHHNHHHDKTKCKTETDRKPDAKEIAQQQTNQSLPDLLVDEAPAPLPPKQTPQTPPIAPEPDPEPEQPPPQFDDKDSIIIERETAEVQEEKPRAVISQEETEDAVAALLGESFGGGETSEFYDHDDVVDEEEPSAALADEPNVQDDEEMRRAVRSLSAATAAAAASAGDSDAKPDTPQSEHDLQIDTDTEEAEEPAQPPSAAVRYQQTPKTPPEPVEYQRLPKTPDLPPYFDDKHPPLAALKTTTTTTSTTGIGSPPSLTPIRKPAEVEKRDLPVLPDTLPAFNKSVIKIEPSNAIIEPSYPPLKPLTNTTTGDVANKISIVQTQTPLPPPQLHNLPARSPVQTGKILEPSRTHNRLPIASVMVQKPLQATTVILQQSKPALNLEPPKLITAYQQDRPRTLYQPPQYTNYPPNNKLTRHVPPQGLLVPSRNAFNFPCYTNLQENAIPPPPLVPKEPIVVAPTVEKPPPVQVSPPSPVQKPAEAVKLETPKSPVSVIVSTAGEAVKAEVEVKTEPVERPTKLAIEAVTDELNLTLEKSSPDVEVKPEEIFDVKEEKADVKRRDEEAVVEDDEGKVVVEEEKPRESEGVKDILVNETSEEKEAKEESDYWLQKGTIDSVIKTLVSPDESERCGEKTDWIDDRKPDESQLPTPIPQPPPLPPATSPPRPPIVDDKPSTIEVEPVEKHPDPEPKSDESEEIVEDSTEPETTEDSNAREPPTLRSSSRRGGRGRGRGGKTPPSRTTAPAGIQTRRGKLKETAPQPAQPPPQPPSKRGRGGKARGERKTSKSEADAVPVASATAPTDVYEFRDESDDGNSNSNKEQRPRLILTIKSPAVACHNATTTSSVKEVTKDGAKEISLGDKETTPNKQQPQPQQQQQPLEKEKDKEEFASPSATNTRKSRRLQERDISKSTVDDTIEDVVKNTVQTRAASATQRRAAAAAAAAARHTNNPIKQSPPHLDATPRKSPRGRKGRRGSEAADNSSSEETVKEEAKTPPPPPPQPPKLEEPIVEKKEPEPLVKEKPHEGLKAAVLRRIKGELIANRNPNEPTNLIDPVTGELIPMRESGEGKYVPLPGTANLETTPNKKPIVKDHQELVKPQPGLIAQLQQLTIVQPPKPQSLKAHVLSSQAAQAIVNQQQTSPLPMVITKSITPIVAPKATTPIAIAKTIVPISQHLSINTNLNVNLPPSPHLSPLNKPKAVKTPALSPIHKQQQQQQLQQIIQTGREHQQHQQQPAKVVHIISAQPQQMINNHMAHVKQHQPQLPPKVAKGAMKPLQQMMGGVAAAACPAASHAPIRLARDASPVPAAAKTVMEPPKVDVSMGNVVMAQRSKLSPQRIVGQTGLPMPGYEPSLHGERSFLNRSRSPPPAHQNSPSPKGEAIAHYPPGPLRPPPDLNPSHYMHPTHVMQYQQYLRQQQLQHYSRSGGMEKVIGDGQEGEEAPVTSPPLELRRPGSVGLPLTSRSAAVQHSLHSPHDRTTDSPQMSQMYNMHSPARIPPYHRYQEPPPAHSSRPVTGYGGLLSALGGDRGMAHMPPIGTADRPLGGLKAHMGPSDRILSAHMDRPMSQGHLGAGLGAAGNLMGAVARHVGADAPASQRGLQAATPPHASQVPAQAESLLMLLKQYPCMWQGLLALKNDQAAVQMYFVSGNDQVAKSSLPVNIDGSTPPLRIFQRMRLEPPQVEGVARKMQMENEHCMLLALPCGHDHMDVLKQSTNLMSGFITYLQKKQAAGIVNVAEPGTTQPPAYVVHIFPSCDFVNENLRRIAPSLLERVADIAHLLIVITTV